MASSMLDISPVLLFWLKRQRYEVRWCPNVTLISRQPDELVGFPFPEFPHRPIVCS